MATDAQTLDHPRTATATPIATPARMSLSRLAVLALLATVAASLVILWPLIDAERRAVIVFSQTSETPLLSMVVRLTTGSPKTSDTTAAGFPATLVRPAHGRRPAVVLIPGPVAGGRQNPSLLLTASALARAGFAVFVPDLPGMIDGEITGATVKAAVDAGEDIARRSDVAGGRIALIGSFAGGTVALLAAEDPALASRVSVVSAIGPWASAPNVLRLATTGYGYDGRELKQYDVDPWFTLTAARSLVAALPASSDRRELLQLLQAVARTDADPLKILRGLALSNLTPDAAAVVSLLANTDAPSFDNLYAALPASVRAQVDRLSPAVDASQLSARVELVQASGDRFAPPGEAALLARTSPHVHVTSAGTTKNGFLQPGWSTNALLVRALRAARR